MAVRREIRDVELAVEQADAEYASLTDRLRVVTQDRHNAEEDLMCSNVRLKQLLGELQEARKLTASAAAVEVQQNRMTMGELTRKVEGALMNVLDDRLNDEVFTSAITEQSAVSVADKVRVEFQGDEVFWALQDSYSFEFLLQDAARYWDIARQDAVLVDERGAIWPNDAFVKLARGLGARTSRSRGSIFDSICETESCQVCARDTYGRSATSAELAGWLECSRSPLPSRDPVRRASNELKDVKRSWNRIE